jgi:CheY-like chemotaxis protein
MTQKLESLGTLAGGIAHNFNNLLTGILGNSSLAQLNMDEKHPVSQRLKNIDNLVQSGAKLTRELLGYAREGRFDPAPMDLNAVITSMADTFSAMRKNICVSCKLDPVLPPVMADAGQVEQVLMNLFINSAEAMPDGGDIQLKTRRIDYRKIADTIYQVKPNRYVELTVTDTGSGMSADTLAHIFEPFFTTKDISNAGRGLGLASVYGIVKGHGGYIDADSEEEKGTRMRVFLPISNQPLSRFTEHKDTHCTRGYGTILMVDDETMVLESGGSMLREMGYTVLEAQSGKEALKRLTYCSHEIHLVLLDLTMPGMSGSETFDRIKALDPELKVLLCSGYSLDGEASNILDRGCEGFIQKPFSMSELQEKIQCILNPQRR